MKNGMGEPKRVITVPISVAKRNGPYAATAAVQPITPAPCRGECEKRIGKCRNVGGAPTRASDPTRGPRNAYVSGSGAPGKLPYSVLMRSGKAAENPENEPKVIT